MTRKDYLYIPAALIVCMILGALLLLLWVVLAIPVMIQPGIVPNPVPKITGIMVKRSMRSAMKAQHPVRQ